jgi:hypothetical protein
MSTRVARRGAGLLSETQVDASRGLILSQGAKGGGACQGHSPLPVSCLSTRHPLFHVRQATPAARPWITVPRGKGRILQGGLT